MKKTRPKINRAIENETSTNSENKITKKRQGLAKISKFSLRVHNNIYGKGNLEDFTQTISSRRR